MHAHPHIRRPHRPWAGPVRALAGAVAVLFLVAHLGSMWHAATEQHERCAEHGELVHAVVVEGQPLVAGTASAVPAGTDESPGDAHDHCQLCPSVCEAPGLPRGASPVIAPPPLAGAAAPDLAPVGDRPLHRLAPKTSPPA